MKLQRIDATSKTLETVLEMYDKLKNANNVFNLTLHEPDKVNVIIGCVPVSLFNDHIKQIIEAVYTEVIKITEKNEDGFSSGIRIATIDKKELDLNPFSSYI